MEFNIKKIWNHRFDIRNIFSSIYFCFHYLPLSQALHLPILLYKPSLLKLNGKITIDSNTKIKYGLIRLGFPSVSIYPNSGIIFENKGGEIIFKGEARIGNNSAISIGDKGLLVIGDKFKASTTLKIICYHNINFGKCVLFGWDCLVMDTDLHKLTMTNGGYNKGFGSVKIGDNNWIGNSCRIMKNTGTPNYCTISAGTVLSSMQDVPEYSIIGFNRKIEILSNGKYRDIDNDQIDYCISD